MTTGILAQISANSCIFLS